MAETINVPIVLDDTNSEMSPYSNQNLIKHARRVLAELMTKGKLTEDDRLRYRVAEFVLCSPMICGTALAAALRDQDPNRK